MFLELKPKYFRMLCTPLNIFPTSLRSVCYTLIPYRYYAGVPESVPCPLKHRPVLPNLTLVPLHSEIHDGNDRPRIHPCPHCEKTFPTK